MERKKLAVVDCCQRAKVATESVVFLRYFNDTESRSFDTTSFRAICEDLPGVGCDSSFDIGNGRFPFLDNYLGVRFQIPPWL